MQQLLLEKCRTLVGTTATFSILKKNPKVVKDEVRILQEVLCELGYGKELNWQKNTVADGRYGSDTTAAVRAFAVDNNLHLAASGALVTKKLAEVILDELKRVEPLDSELVEAFSNLLAKKALADILKKKSNKKADIRILQRGLCKLGFEKELKGDNMKAIDGDYGNNTTKAILAFAKKNNLHLAEEGTEVPLKLAKVLLIEAEKATRIQMFYQLGYGKVLNGKKYGDPNLDIKAAENAFAAKEWPKDPQDGSLLAQYEMANSLAILKRIKKNKSLNELKTNQIKAVQTLLYYLSDAKERKGLKSTVLKSLITRDMFKYLRKGPDWPVDPMAPMVPVALGAYDEHLTDKELKKQLENNRKLFDDHFNNKPHKNKMCQGDIFDKDSKKWVKPTSVGGKRVSKLQSFLIDIGLMPSGTDHGLFDYTTLAGVRMFQEYIRIYRNPKMRPTGIIDQQTLDAITKWQAEKRKIKHWPRGEKSEEYIAWLGILQKIKTDFKDGQFKEEGSDAYPKRIISKVHQAIKKNKKTSTIKLGDWNFEEKNIHLIGIRRKEDTDGTSRKNDDLFILLIGGMVFKFWGSTDSHNDPKEGEKKKAILPEGQHKYRLGWHNFYYPKDLYPALYPRPGVLIFRDQNINKKFDEGDEGELTLNKSINIHWAGSGVSNNRTWSEGCQVIAGKWYIDPMGKRRDYDSFAAVSGKNLKENSNETINHTKGAYNVFFDLLLLFRNQKNYHIYYTLLRDDTFIKYFEDAPKMKAILRKSLKDFNLVKVKDFNLVKTIGERFSFEKNKLKHYGRYTAGKDDQRFFLGKDTKYTTNYTEKSIKKSYKRTGLGQTGYGIKYEAKDYRGEYGHWANILEAIGHGESNNYFNVINSYDRAAFTFGFFQLAAHTPNNNLILFFRNLVQEKEAKLYFPELTLKDGKVHRVNEDGSFIDLEAEGSFNKSEGKLRKYQLPNFMQYLNSDQKKVDEEELLMAARLIHWTNKSEAFRKLQVKTAVDITKNRVETEYAAGYYKKNKLMDGMDDITFTIICDIHHNGRASSRKVKDILKSSSGKENNIDALLNIGSNTKWIKTRNDGLRKTINKMKRKGELGTMNYDQASNSFVPA